MCCMSKTRLLIVYFGTLSNVHTRAHCTHAQIQITLMEHVQSLTVCKLRNGSAGGDASQQPDTRIWVRHATESKHVVLAGRGD
jgi:hypothetical protein